MIYYAAHTTGERNRAAIAAHGFGMLCSASYRAADSVDRSGRLWSARSIGGPGLALDNGAYTYWKSGAMFDDNAFAAAVLDHGPYDFVVVPDVVMDAEGTRAMARRWLRWTAARAWAPRVLLPVQNGMEVDELPLGPRIGVFVGGDSEWKERTTPLWRHRTAAAGAYLHVGRVNTRARIDLCRAWAVDSCDGSGAAIFSIHADRVGRWTQGPSQRRMW